MTDLLPFFLERYAAEIPTRTHSRETAANGNPEWHRAFEAWLTDGDGKWQTHVREDQDHCSHPTRENPCPTCEGTGLRIRIRSVYRHPVKRALQQLATIPVPKGRPGLDATLIVLAENDGNIGLTIAALAQQHSYFWQPVKARRWILHALWQFRAAYREDAPAKVLSKRSEAQQIADAA